MSLLPHQPYSRLASIFTGESRSCTIYFPPKPVVAALENFNNVINCVQWCTTHTRHLDHAFTHLDPLTTPRPVLLADSSHPAVGNHELSTRTWNHFYTDRIFCIFHQLTSWRRRLLAAAAVVFPLVWRGTWKFSEILREFLNYIILYLKQEHIFVTLTKTNKQRSETLITK